MLQKYLATWFLAMAGLALASGAAAAPMVGDGGHFGPDNCYYVPYHGQWARMGCQWTQDNHTFFRDEFENGTLYVLVQGAYGPQWMRGDQYLEQLQALAAQQPQQPQHGQQGRQDVYRTPDGGIGIVVGPPDDGLPTPFTGAMDNVPGTNSWIAPEPHRHR